MSYTVYMLTNKINKKKYIGVTQKRIERRWNNGYGYRTQKHIFEDIEKYGWDNFDHTIISVMEDKEAACKLEESLIISMETNNPENGYNKQIGGKTGCSGIVRSQLIREKYSRGHLGEKHKQERIARRLMEWKAKPKIKSRMLQQIDPKINEVINTFNTTFDAIRTLGIGTNRNNARGKFSSISAAARGLRKTAYGYKWNYIDE